MSQNLVSNGCFEQKSICPNGGGQISNAIGWTNPETFTDPDYYNTCVTFTNTLGIPHNIAGYQYDCNGGGAYAALYALEPQYPNDGHEYIQTKLVDSLLQFHKYVGTVHVSLSNYSSYAVGSIAMYFTPNAIQGPFNVGFINVPNPQVKSTSELTDTLNWMAVQDTFVAQGGEQYLTIGNFSPDSLSDTLYLGWRGQNGSYYYIDSVTVYDTGLTSVAEKKNEETMANIFPNPNNGDFEIRYALKEDAALEICDLHGRSLVKTKLSASANNTRLHCEGLENGIYLYRVTSREYESPVKKLVIAK